MAEKVDSDDESEQHSGDDYGDQPGSVPWYGDYHYGQPADYNWPAYSGYSGSYCDTMYHTRFYHQKNPMNVQVSLVV
jgi:hypothetical protein